MKLLDISSKGKEINEQVYEWNFHIITDKTMPHDLIVELGAACDEAIQEVFRKYGYKVEL